MKPFQPAVQLFVQDAPGDCSLDLSCVDAGPLDQLIHRVSFLLESLSDKANGMYCISSCQCSSTGC